MKACTCSAVQRNGKQPSVLPQGFHGRPTEARVADSITEQQSVGLRWLRMAHWRFLTLFLCSSDDMLLVGAVHVKARGGFQLRARSSIKKMSRDAHEMARLPGSHAVAAGWLCSNASL